MFDTIADEAAVCDLRIQCINLGGAALESQGFVPPNTNFIPADRSLIPALLALRSRPRRTTTVC